MNRKKLLKKLQSLIDKSDDAKKQDIKKLHKVVKELKHKQKRLEHRLEDIRDEKERAKITKEIEVIKLQRKKGNDVYWRLQGELGADSLGDPD